VGRKVAWFTGDIFRFLPLALSDLAGGGCAARAAAFIAGDEGRRGVMAALARIGGALLVLRSTPRLGCARRWLWPMGKEGARGVASVAARVRCAW
jgi:hypothetical protein